MERKQIYPWQEAALRKWEESGYHGIFDVVTGAGKTCLALFGVQKLKQQPEHSLVVFVVVPTVVLMEQWIREIRAWFPGERVGRIGGGRKCGDQLEFQVFIVNSARTCLPQRRDKLLSQGKAVLLIADECHHYGSKENRRIFESARGTIPAKEPESISPDPVGSQWDAAYYTMGLSATPDGPWYREVLCRYLGSCVFSYRHPEALKDRIIAGFCLYQIGLNFYGKEAELYAELSGRMSTQYARLLWMCPQLQGLPRQKFFTRLRQLALEEGDPTAAAYYFLLLRRKDLVNQSQSRLECGAELIRQLDPAARILVFTERIAQADAFAALLAKELPESFGRVHSGRSKENSRRELREFQEGHIRILITCKVLDEGMDVPDADAAIVLSGTATLRQHIQRLGRILRKGQRGKLAALYYLYLKESSEGGDYLADPETAWLQLSEDMGAEEYSAFSLADLNTGNPEAPRLNCRYYAAEKSFSNPCYEETAAALLGRLRGKSIGRKEKAELRSCLLEGLLRPDWLRTPEECEERAAAEPERENYWLAAKMMAQQRIETGGNRQ